MPKCRGDEMLSANMVRLEELEAKFDSDPFSELPVTQWELEGQIVKAWSLLVRRGVVSVVKSFVPAGCVFPIHSHQEVEVLVVYEGKARYRSSTPVERILLPGDCVRILPGTAHEFEGVEDTWVIGITVPDSEAFAR